MITREQQAEAMLAAAQALLLARRVRSAFAENAPLIEYVDRRAIDANTASFICDARYSSQDDEDNLAHYHAQALAALAEAESAIRQADVAIAMQLGILPQ